MAAAVRVVGTHDERQVAEPSFPSEETMALIDMMNNTDDEKAKELPLAITA